MKTIVNSIRITRHVPGHGDGEVGGHLDALEVAQFNGLVLEQMFEVSAREELCHQLECGHEESEPKQIAGRPQHNSAEEGQATLTIRLSPVVEAPMNCTTAQGDREVSEDEARPTRACARTYPSGAAAAS